MEHDADHRPFGGGRGGREGPGAALGRELLHALVRNRGRLLTHRVLLTEVWGPEYADDTMVLRGQIANLRRK
jgi:two-component system, OmpR family, KDP operon response regulator KdpE